MASFVTAGGKLDQAISKLDDWDLLQAVFEAVLEANDSLPGVSAQTLLADAFPMHLGKPGQIQRLNAMMSQRNAWAFGRKESTHPVPKNILSQALLQIQNEARLKQDRTVRELLKPYQTALRSGDSQVFMRRREPWAEFFQCDFLDYLLDQKMQGYCLLLVESEQAELTADLRPAPGALRVLEVLKQRTPGGLTVKQLAPLVKKDALSLDVPESSVSVWLSQLNKLGVVSSQGSRPKTWFFVTDYKP